MATTKTDLIAMLTANIVVATRMQANAHGWCLVDERCTLAVGSAGDTLRFVSPTIDSVVCFTTHMAARQSAANWNKQLTDAQLSAKCNVHVASQFDMLADYIAVQKELLVALAA